MNKSKELELAAKEHVDYEIGNVDDSVLISADDKQAITKERTRCYLDFVAGAEWQAAQSPSTGSGVPKDVAIKLIAIREALVKNDYEEAYHQLYAIASPKFDKYQPWEELEKITADESGASSLPSSGHTFQDGYNLGYAEGSNYPTPTVIFLNKLIDLIVRYRKNIGETGVGNHVENEIKQYLAKFPAPAPSREAELRAEIERLKKLIEDAYYYGIDRSVQHYSPEIYWKAFREEHNLYPSLPSDNQK